VATVATAAWQLWQLLRGCYNGCNGCNGCVTVAATTIAAQFAILITAQQAEHVAMLRSIISDLV
jgi:hypothetical protein